MPSKINKNKTKKELSYTDGALAEEETSIKDLEQLLNPSAGYNPFKTTVEDEFVQKMGDMSIPELQSLAVEIGVFPSGNKTTLRNKLKKEFRKKFFLGKGNVVQQTKPVVEQDNLTEEQKKFFNFE
tara:strand:+ start:929 stop:1306 length:378 start_codon:yes stop_codon:yes gene_type:complete